ncbi:MAG TPA: hypothetical protein VM712_11745 [Gaiellales bacterium]|jgi:hypothetical protein|nr:hypothetical protein [Gaiellales bacterium]
MSGVHETLGAITIGVNWVAALLGGLAWLTRRRIPGFWWLLRTGQALIIVEAVTGAALLLDGRDLPRLHLIYGLIPIAVSFVAEQLRLTAAQTVLDQHDLEGAADVAKLPEPEQHALVALIVRRETATMTASAAVVALLAMRAQGWL